MKTIYTFTFKTDMEEKSSLASDIRLFAYMLYDVIRTSYEIPPFNMNDNITYNNINDRRDDSGYKLDSDLYDDDSIDYEPFIIGDNSFGFTIVEDSFDIEKINEAVQGVLKLLKFDYEIIIHSQIYNAKDMDDESERDDALARVFENLGYEYHKKTGFFARLLGGRHSNKNR